MSAEVNPRGLPRQKTSGCGSGDFHRFDPSACHHPDATIASNLGASRLFANEEFKTHEWRYGSRAVVMDLTKGHGTKDNPFDLTGDDGDDEA